MTNLGLRRRTLMRGGLALFGAGALPLLFARRIRATVADSLVPDPAGVLDLAPGFSYRVIERSGSLMTDGFNVPGAPDGMGCFAGSEGTIVLMRNHEVGIGTLAGPCAAGQQVPAEAYNPAAGGGVTRLVLDASTFERRSSNLVLAGTLRNCGGGVSPWGWLSCEETFSEGHGYAFLCDVDAERVRPAVVIPCYGHLYHEAVAVDPRTGAAYLTEDRSDGCLYRFLPDERDEPFIGRFQALRVPGRATTGNGIPLDEPLEVEWVDLEDPNPSVDSLRATAVAGGATTFVRGEGIWFAGGVFYVTATTGGAIGLGQVFALSPSKSGGTLTLLAEATGANLLQGPDNVTVAPWGDVVICEDGFDGGPNSLRILTQKGELFELARSTLAEFAGVCFDPTGRALFVNLLQAGLTLSIRGPFASFGGGRPEDAVDGGSSTLVRGISRIGGGPGCAR